jgi:broad specificity phosphatase PhoE
LGKIQGQQNIPLNDAGRRQAKRLADTLQSVSFAAIYSSDLCRAYETAEAVARRLQLDIRRRPALRERFYGKWEGRPFHELEKKIPDIRVSWNEPGEGIESLRTVKQRMVEELEAITAFHPGETVLVVSHGGAINTFIHHVSNGSTGTGKLRLGNTAINRFRYDRGLWTIEETNDTRHLLGLSV